MQLKLKSIAAVILAAAASVNAAPTADETAANKVLAERFAILGQQTLASRAVVPATLRQAAALLEEACALSPNEPRFGRLLTEAYLQLGGDEGRKGAIISLDRYRRLVPGDQSSQIRLIELYAGMVETAEKLGKYYDQLLADDGVPAPVKSHVAILAANLARERGDDARRSEMTDAAVRLSPLNSEALEAKYASLPEDTKPADRLAILLKMIQANPAQPAVMNTIADVCADTGLYDSALNWYQQSTNLSGKLGIGADLSAMTGYAAELIVADQSAAATNIKALLDADPTNSEAGMLGLVLSMKSSDPARVDAAADIAKQAIRARLAQLSGTMTDAAAPTTQPLDDNGVTADVAKLKESDNENLKTVYVASLVDLAWVDIYGRGKPADAQATMTALRQLLPEDSATLARLDGWSYLVDGKKDEALVKLSAVADRDPLAQLGLVRLNGVTDNDAARKLVSTHPSGVLGAMLMEALRGRVGLMQPNADGPAIRAELDKFPRNWLNILDNPRQFYVLKAAPADNKIAFNYGDAVNVQATITNTGTADLTVGATGAVRPDLWFDVNVRGLNSQTLAGVAFDRMGGKLVLGPKESNTQVVRIDQGPLYTLLSDNPGTSVPLYGSVLTNPLTQSAGVAPGPAGTREQFSSVIERTAAPLNDSVVLKASQQVVNGSGDERLRNVDLLAALVRQIRAANKPEMLPRGQEMVDLIRKSTGDRVAAVRAESFATTAALSDASMSGGILQQMLADSEPMIRAIGLATAQRLTDGKTLKAMAQPMADGDADPIVKKLAAAMIQVADLPVPTTQPAASAADGTAPQEPQNK